jgi:hypothetical protein
MQICRESYFVDGDVVNSHYRRPRRDSNGTPAEEDGASFHLREVLRGNLAQLGSGICSTADVGHWARVEPALQEICKITKLTAARCFALQVFATHIIRAFQLR